MIRFMTIAVLLISNQAFASFESLQEQERQQATQNKYNNDVQSYIDMFNKENAKTMGYAQSFARSHGGFAQGPEITYTNFAANMFYKDSCEENPAYAYATQNGPGEIEKINFTTADGYECRAAIYGVECINGTTGKHINAYGLYAEKSGGQKSAGKKSAARKKRK